MGTTVHSKIANAAGDIQKKYEAILKLEESVNELFRLFEDLANMIQEQGEMLDNIESNMTSVRNHFVVCTCKMRPTMLITTICRLKKG